LIDELGYLPIDKTGADLLFQVFSQRTNWCDHRHDQSAYKHWPKIFNNDSTLTSAVLDRLLHHAETVIVEGRSYRMKIKSRNLNQRNRKSSGRWRNPSAFFMRMP